MSPELNNLLYQDGRGKSILEQVNSKQISLEEATKMAKSEALSRSAELERSNPDTRPTPRNYEREVDGQRTPFEFVSLAPSTFGKIRAASGISPAEYGLSFATPPSGNLAGGASGSFVKKSHDSRLIIKSIDKTETEVLLRVLQVCPLAVGSIPIVRPLALSDTLRPADVTRGGAVPLRVTRGHHTARVVGRVLTRACDPVCDATQSLPFDIVIRVQDYLAHLDASPYSLLVRFLGLYEVRIENRTMSVVVMENILDKVRLVSGRRCLAVASPCSLRYCSARGCAAFGGRCRLPSADWRVHLMDAAN